MTFSLVLSARRYVLPELAVPKNVSFVALLQDSDGPDHGRVSQVVTSGEPVQAGSDCLRQVVAEDGVFFVDPSTPTTCGCSFGWSEAAMDPIGITGQAGRGFLVRPSLVGRPFLIFVPSLRLMSRQD